MDINTYPNKDHDSPKEDQPTYELRNGYKVVLPKEDYSTTSEDKGGSK